MKKRIFSILLSIGLTLTLLPGTVLADDKQTKDVYIDNTVDNSVSIITGVVHITGSGGTQAGYYEGKTVYEGQEQENVTYYNPKTDAVQEKIDAAYTIVDTLSKGVKERGKRGEYHMSMGTSTGRVWDHRKYETIEEEEIDGQIIRTHIATGDYGKETFYRVEANGWVAGYDITTAADPEDGGTATSDLTASLSGETVTFTATPADGYEFHHWEVVDSSGKKQSGNANYPYTMPASDVTATAVFAPVQINLCTSRSDGGVLKLESTDGFNKDAWMTNMAVDSGSQVTMVAEPDEGYEFAGYYEGIRQMDPSKEGYGFVTDYDPNMLISNDKNYTFTITEDTNVYALFRKTVIDKVEITVEAPVCGTETATPDKDHSWGSQTNPPSISVPDGAGYKLLIMYEGASPAIWVKPDSDYEPFEGRIEGENSYTAQILLEPDSGAVFSEDVAVSVNGELPVYVKNNTSSLEIIASVTAVHIPAEAVEENRVKPTCTKAGSYDEVVYCEGCGTELSREKKEIPALGHAWGEWIVDKEATEEEDGRRHRECSRCDAVEVEKIPMIVATYGVVEGDGATWYTGSNDSLTFTFKRSVNDEKTFELFQRIEIDGKEVAPANYEAKAGSVIITLKPEYIKTLAVGKHTLTAFFENGKTANASFTIAEKKADVVPGGDTAKKGTGVKTGDNANAVLYMGLGIAALLIIAVTLILLKRRERQEQ